MSKDQLYCFVGDVENVLHLALPLLKEEFLQPQSPDVTALRAEAPGRGDSNDVPFHRG